MACHTALVVFVWFFVGHFHESIADLFTSMTDMESLLFTDRNLDIIIDEYIRLELNRIEQLKQFLRDRGTTYKKVRHKDTSYVANPVNAYLITKRLLSDWNKMVPLMQPQAVDEFLKSVVIPGAHHRVKFPTAGDLQGVTAAILRLQDTYQIDTTELASGKVGGVRKGEELSALDCFDIGMFAHNNTDFRQAILWLQESLSRTKAEETPGVRIFEVLGILADSWYHSGDVEKALASAKRLYSLDPKNPHVSARIEQYQSVLASRVADGRDAVTPSTEINDWNGLSDTEIYKALCRGELSPAEDCSRHCHCYYKSDHPFLLIAPLKVEIIHKNPLIIIFRQVVTDSEAAAIKQLAAPRLTRSKVVTSTGGSEASLSRISKNTGLADYHPVIKGINIRLQQMTNLDMKMSEEIQNENTGENKRESKGDRIATVLFYLSQPESGGATVFPKLRLSIYPSKNDALFWFNLLRSGRGDKAMLHAGCPVLSGSKWIANKFIKDHGQEFRYPCGIEEHERIRAIATAK